MNSRHLPINAAGFVVEVVETFDPPTTPLDENGQGDPYAVFGSGAHMAEIEVDVELGRVKVLRLICAHDVGRAINPTLVEGQIEGGAAQGLGLALMEEFFPGKGENLHDYLIPTIGDMPPVECILIEDASSVGPFGAKGIGEQALIPTAPAIFNAIHHATGARIRRAPATPDRVRAGHPRCRGESGHDRRRRQDPLRRLPGACATSGPGMTGACDRYANRDGQLVRVDPHVLLDRAVSEGGKVVPFVDAEARLERRHPQGARPVRHRCRRRHHLSRL